MAPKNLKKPFFISIEGVEGAGKSTVINYLKRLLSLARIETVFTREPGGTPFAEEIRNLLLKHHEESCLPETELLLLYAGRHQHVQKIIKPALAQGNWVVCDRFVDATYAYQGAGRGIATKHIDQLTNWLLPNLIPDLTLLLDLSVDESFKRISGKRKDRFEVEDHAFFTKIREAYLDRAKNEPKRFTIIDAKQPHEAVAADIEEALSSWISAWFKHQKEMV
jgi:dTMP kinase